MPTIRIDYDAAKLADEDILVLSKAVQKVVIEAAAAAGIPSSGTFVYA